MNVSGRQRHVLMLHFTVLVWGFTGVLGALITIPALHLVWYRVLIAALALFAYLKIKGKPVVVSKRDLFNFFAVGLIVGLHWILFFHAIKISTVSVALVTMSSITLFTAVLEPLFNRSTISVADVLIGLLIIFGIYLIFKFEFQYVWGIICGLLCALCASLFSIFNARMVKKNSPTLITFYEMIGAFAGISLVLGFTDQFDDQLLLSLSDTGYLLFLGVVCTAFAYVLGVAVMKELGAFTVALTTNLEPIYGIILAVLIFGQRETMSLGFYSGAVIILIAVFIYPYFKTRLDQKQQSLTKRKVR